VRSVDFKEAVKMSTKNSLGKQLHKLMAQHNVTEANLARIIKLPQPTLNRLLSGQTEDPRISTLRKLSSYFNVTLDYLINDPPTAIKTKFQRVIPINEIPLGRVTIDGNQVVMGIVVQQKNQN
jgi:transcriptional regulator with XRE-family HTH domain